MGILKAIFKAVAFCVLALIAVPAIWLFTSVIVAYLTDWYWTHGEVAAVITIGFSIITGILLAKWMVYE